MLCAAVGPSQGIPVSQTITDLPYRDATSAIVEPASEFKLLQLLADG